MYYLDSQRTITRRDSSLIVPKRPFLIDEVESVSTARGQSSARLWSESLPSLMPRPPGTVRKEIVTLMFESMLDNVVESWETLITHQKPEDSVPSVEIGKTQSELNVKQKKKYSAKPSKTGRRSRSRLELAEIDERQQMVQQSWWSSPDERAIIRFRNGNLYEGSISMKSMHGTGRFHWADGTIYMGQFKDNEICGTGLIQWKDDTWFEGSFQGNLRHGRGLFVDSRRQRSYVGDWHFGSKHGQGIIYYSDTFKNSYDGEWVHNVRHGSGSREYCQMSGYDGEWDRGIREGKGLMIWPNHDFYTGHWKNGVMSGYGYYIWDTFFNNSMSLPSMNTYRGMWEKGQRNGFGVLTLGLGLGSHYTGEFKNNKKHGVGKFVSNNGLILRNDQLFTDDNLGPLLLQSPEGCARPNKLPEPFEFNICDSSVGLLYHIEQALSNIDREHEIRTALVNEYLQNNKGTEVDMLAEKRRPTIEERLYDEIIEFEEISLKKALRCYETKLRGIYHQYATICNHDEVKFGPIMIRLYLWQLYYDCQLQQNSLSLVEIDNIFSKNPQWLARKPHDPFEKIYFWQFLHSLVSVASRLYAQRHLPGVKPDTILASAFRKFMDVDILPKVGQRQGRLVNIYADFVPLKAVYDLYQSIGEPHTIRQFLCAARRSPDKTHCPLPPIIDAPDDGLPLGQNYYVYGDEMTFSTDEPFQVQDEEFRNERELKLFNFGNLSSKTILKIFESIFPQLFSKNKIMALDIEITFFEFFEAFMACTEESIRVKDEEIRWREKFEHEMGVLV